MGSYTIGLGSPRAVYEKAGALYYQINRAFVMRLVAMHRAHARFRLEPAPGCFMPKWVCENTKVAIERYPTNWGLPRAVVEEPECAAQGAPACVWDVRWKNPPIGARFWACTLAGAAASVFAHVAWTTGHLTGSEHEVGRDAARIQARALVEVIVLRGGGIRHRFGAGQFPGPQRDPLGRAERRGVDHQRHAVGPARIPGDGADDRDRDREVGEQPQGIGRPVRQRLDRTGHHPCAAQQGLASQHAHRLLRVATGGGSGQIDTEHGTPGRSQGGGRVIHRIGERV